MNIASPLHAIAITLCAALVVFMLSLLSRGRVVSGRFSTIDGLRGYLALFVFIHHSVIWFAYTRTGVWSLPNSNLYILLGQASVSLFFMITSFLFFDKLLVKRKNNFDWIGFFVGRVCRLFPLYIVAMLCLFFLVAIISHGEIKDSPLAILNSLTRWIGFSVLGAPDVNLVNANLITAGVTWSLPYEWCFYLILPLIWVLIGGHRATAFVVLSLLTVGWIFYRGMSLQISLNFAGGMIAALLIRNDYTVRVAKSRVGSLLVLVLLCILSNFSTAYENIPFVVLTILFSLIACGASIFGLLNSKVSHGLGEMAYSIYLLHGIILFIIIKFLIGFGALSRMSSSTYTAVIVCVVPLLLVLSTLTFKFVESPWIAFGKRWGHSEKEPSISSGSEAVKFPM